MKNQFNKISSTDEKLKRLDKDIIWKEQRKSKIEDEILLKMESEQSKTKLLEGFKYASSIGVVVILMIFGYNLLSDTITHQSGESPMGNQGNQTNMNSSMGDKKDNEAENDKKQSTSEVMDANKMEIRTGNSETITRVVEGMEQEVKVINYYLPSYGITYQIDEIFGVPEVNQNQITYSAQNDDYKIMLEMIEHTNLEKTTSNLQEKFESEGYEENFELESTPLEENNLRGKMQFYGYPVKGFIVYEVNQHVLAITFQYPEEGGDGMYPILEDLRKSIHVQ